jgi:acyl-CoA thioester hydrolase
VPSNDEIVHELPMRWADLDSLNHVNNVVYVDYAAESRALLVEDGLLDSGLGVTHMAVRYARPLLLTRHPVLVVSSVDADTVTQQICVDRDGARTVFAKVVTRLGAPAPTPRAEVADEPLPARIRRSDLDSTGVVGPTKTFELFQEGRILYVSNHLAGLSAGQFVVGTVTVDFHEPIIWSRDPYQMRGWISRVGASSVTIEAELSDGDAVLARATTFLVGFDLKAQKSRAFSAEERAVFDELRVPSLDAQS